MHKAFAPGHITGFVEFPIKHGDTLSIGSRGAGVCINKGVLTCISLRESNKNNISIYINDKIVNNADVSLYVARYYLSLLKKRFDLTIKHYIDIPIGYGIGSSGAAALSLSYALNDALQLFDKLHAAQIAHIADLECKCGMGTVVAEYHGGFEMRLEAGAPGISKVKKLDYDKDNVIVLCLDAISTKEFLTNKISLINGIGGKMLTKLDSNPTIDNFLDLSSRFARSVKFMSKKCYSIMDELLEHGYNSSLAMFGETIFTIVSDNDVEYVKTLLERYGKVIVAKIDNNGARIIDTIGSS
ncbi:MAG: hypothetical protein QW416_02985 [Candidatus Nitrosocaldaceae archaeon]